LYIKIVIFLTLCIVIVGCKHKRPDPNFYKNLYTNEVLSKSEFDKFSNNLHLKYRDTIRGKLLINMNFDELVFSKDSIIQPFNYDVRLGKEYIVRANSYEKIGMKILPQKFQTSSGESIYIGGKQKKPMLVNLWFIRCPGCIGEIPALNRLQEKYADKVDFVAMTFEQETDVLKFLKGTDFKFKQIVNSENFIKQIGTKPYPENIFINKNGRIEYIENGLDDREDLDSVIPYFESLLKKLL
jgi:thiol-disulfide isomerase/thioredoxin